MNKTTFLPSPEIIDSHCHLDFPDFENDLEDVIKRAKRVGVQKFVTICTRLDAEAKTRRISERFQEVFYAAGTHPLYVSEVKPVLVEELVASAQHPKFVGIGETGLDYHYSRAHEALQKDSFLVHIEAARQTGLPLIIHARSADADMIKILEREYKAGAFSCVMHCFSSSQELATTALDLGFYLSMSGIAAFPKSNEVRAIFAGAPLDKILLETDAPYLAPPPHRGKRNEPAYTVHTAKIGAEIFNLTYDAFAHQTNINFKRLFSKVANFSKNT